MFRRWKSSSVDPLEIAKFSKAAQEWWAVDGEFGLLHRMNPVRVAYVRQILSQNLSFECTKRPFEGLSMLDVGCGGGLLSESLARLGASVTAIDASPENIGIAHAHAIKDPDYPSSLKIDYQCTTAEDLAQSGIQFDAVLSLEVIEHVSHPFEFIKSCTQLLKPKGHLFLSTINRTPASYIFTILIAEHLLRMVPPGTHDHPKYLTPQELTSWVKENGCALLDISGLALNPLTRQWSLLNKNIFGALEMNYILSARKQNVTKEPASATI